MVFCKAFPIIDFSVSQLGPDTYQMGSKFLCKKATGEIPQNAVVSWEDGDGQYYLVEATDMNPPVNTAEGLIHQAGTSSAVWAIGTQVVCKVKTWVSGMERESDTLAFVASRFPHIPIPEVIYSWVDEPLNRTFLILRRIQGQTLLSAWPSLTTEQKADMATTVAQYCRDLSEATAEGLQSATGCGVLEPFLNVEEEESHPSWKPTLLGPFSRIATEKYFQRISPLMPSPIGDRFHFYHADLGPTNILLTDDGAVRAIIDWESAGYFPKC
ncbi:kinase-like domain-containing protein [Aspergillus avenaceus]|uniref:Kinase-like domain-containing protein n=1 Tax=Aspergillus avenaceus TaxID=36643 RepID=A0A5N6TMC6_ASPAV|nr:kinase-like domain-containing protein [Aspergillus avenaceus]